MHLDDALLEVVSEVAREAGRTTLRYYGRVTAELKEDGSPVTAADRAAQEVILEGLARHTPGVPVLSEEAPVDTAERRRWSTFWLVDPLDGTKEFLKQSGEYTVNIALVSAQEPVLGVVCAPVTGVVWAAARGLGAWRVEPGGARQALRTRAADMERLVVLASRDHAGPEVEALLRRLPGATTANLGSSLKFCHLAEGRADFYPRLSPTSEWDTAAAQCVLEVAGGGVVDTSGQRLAYNKERLANPSFIAFGDPRQDWLALLTARG